MRLQFKAFFTRQSETFPKKNISGQRLQKALLLMNKKPNSDVLFDYKKDVDESLCLQKFKI